MKTLWHRTKNRPWKPIATAATADELNRLLLTLPSGESILLPEGEHPEAIDKGRAAVERIGK